MLFLTRGTTRIQSIYKVTADPSSAQWAEDCLFTLRGLRTEPQTIILTMPMSISLSSTWFMLQRCPSICKIPGAVHAIQGSLHLIHDPWRK